MPCHDAHTFLHNQASYREARSATEGGRTIRTENRIQIQAPLEIVLRLAKRVEAWPRILAHYRSVEVLAIRPAGRIVEMKAVRKGVPMPVRWRALQRVPDTPDDGAYRVTYRHIGGVTRGMHVEWIIEPSNPATHLGASDGQVKSDVTIIHDFAPNWPPPGAFIARRIVCDFFVHAIADQTLAGIKVEAEREYQLTRIPSDSSGFAEFHPSDLTSLPSNDKRGAAPENAATPGTAGSVV